MPKTIRLVWGHPECDVRDWNISLEMSPNQLQRKNIYAKKHNNPLSNHLPQYVWDYMKYKNRTLKLSYFNVSLFIGLCKNCLIPLLQLRGYLCVLMNF